MMITVATLADMRASGYYLWASCENRGCSHCADLDTDMLIERFGEDFQFVDERPRIVAALRCSGCGRKGVSIRLAQVDTPEARGAIGLQSGS